MSIGLFVASAATSIWLEAPFDRWTQRLCEAQSVQFTGKHIQIFASPWFIFGLAAWAVIVFLLVRRFSIRQRALRMVIVLAVFCVVVVGQCA